MSRTGKSAEDLFGLNSRLKWMAVCVSVSIALAIPLVFFITAYHFESEELKLRAERIADRISEFAYAQPIYWKYSDEVIGEFFQLAKIGDIQSTHRLVDSDGKIILEVGQYPDFPGHVRGADVVEGQNTVARVLVAVSLQPILGDTLWVALLGFALAASSFVILRTLPLQASEATRTRLEQQNDDLGVAAEKLAAAMDTAEIANLAKSQFLANMSHELRTPLNAIIGFSEIIKAETYGPVGSVKYREYSRDIHQSGLQLLALINDILDLSKVESGEEDLFEEEIAIGDLTQSIRRLLSERAQKGGIDLVLECDDDLPALRADKRKVLQILVNLLGNAIKFTYAGGKVILKIWWRPDSGYVFQVIDTGIGMALDDIPKALSRFGQVDGDLDRRYDGTGLGLPLAKVLVELHGGVLDLQSQLGSGTTATVRFPAERAVQVARQARAASRSIV